MAEEFQVKVVVKDSESEGEEEEELTMESLTARLDGLGVNTAVMSKETLETIFTLHQNYSERAEVTGEYVKRRMALELEYETKYAAVDAKRASILAGAGEAAADGAAESEVEGEKAAAADATPKLPGFWCTTMRQHSTIENFITEADTEALTYMTNLESKLDEDMEGFTLTFTFAENPFFENKVLTKHYGVDNLVSMSEEPVLTGVEGCSIAWKAGKCLTGKARAGRGKRRAAKPSFFTFFDPPADRLQDASSMEEANEMMEQLELDFQLGMMLRSNIVPHAIAFFTGEAEADDSDEEFVPGEDDEEEDDEEGEDGEEGGDETPAFNFDFTAPTEGDDKPADGEEKPECNQQ